MEPDPFVAQLGELCRSHVTSPKWVIIGTHAVGRALGERLAREGHDWVDLRFVTPFGLALGIAAPLLLERRLDPLPEGLGSCLAMRLLMDLPSDERSYFAPLADQPRMGAALWAAISELRLAGVVAATLPAAAFDDSRKHRELAALLASYESYLADHRQADAADVYRAAAGRLDWSPIAPGDIVIEAPDLGVPAPLVRAFLDSQPGHRTPCAVPLVLGLDAPRRSGDSSRRLTRVPSRLACLLEPAQAPPADEDEGLELFHAAGREAEAEAVLRRILAARSAVALDQVEVACASAECADLFWEKAQRLDLPVTIERGMPIATTRPARALLAFCSWVESNFVAGRLRRLFQAGDLRIEFPDGGRGGQAARILLRSQATWGRDTYRQSLAALAARYASDAGKGNEPDEEAAAASRAKAARAEFLREYVHELLALVPEPDAAGSVSLVQLVNGLSSLLDARVTVASALDGAAVAAMRQSLAELRSLGDLRRPVAQAIAFVRDAVDRLRVGASRARPGHLHVSTLARAGFAGRPFTYVVGLEEGGVFPSLLEDPVLLDDERRRLSPSLPTSHDRLEESVHAVLSRLAVLPLAQRPAGGVSVSCSCRDLREARETFPSWLMLQVLRARHADPSLSYEDLRERLGAPETLVPSTPPEALTDAGWWLAATKGLGSDRSAAILDAFPSLAAGREADEARRSAPFTEWDGSVPLAAPVLDPRASGQAVSVTRLERLVECPFRYFLEHGLGVEVTDGEDPDLDEWLDALQRGAALHEVYAALGREARARGKRLEPRHDAFRARRLAEQKLQALRADFPPPSEVVFDRERAEFLRDVELFLEFEASRTESEPVAFEVAFGHEGGGEEPLAQVAPVTISLGQGRSFLLRGTIDRIDRLNDGSFEIIDYKTGGCYRDKYTGTFGGGALLQHALYGLAAAALLRGVDPKPRIARGVYEFPSARGGGERVPIRPPSREKIVAVLSDLFDVMANGAFVPADDDGVCRRCDFARACDEPVTQSAAKLANPKNARLDPLRRLRDHD